MSLKNPTTPGLLIDGQWSKAWLVSLLSKHQVVKPWLEMLGTWLYMWYIFMYVLDMYKVTRQARKFNPALQETSNAWDLPGRVTPDMGQITQVSSMAEWHIRFWRPLIWGTVLDTPGLFWIWNCPVFCWGCSFWAILKWLMECEPSTKYGHSHQKRGCFSKKTVVLLMYNEKNHLHLAGRTCSDDSPSQPTSWRHGEAIVTLTTINERKRIWDDMWLCPRCGTANPK